MKLKTTKKEVISQAECIAVGYCHLQHLLRDESPIAYTCGTGGWNADIYACPPPYTNVMVVTGYRPFGASVPYTLSNHYDQIAQDKTPEERKVLFREFVQAALALKK